MKIFILDNMIRPICWFCLLLCVCLLLSSSTSDNPKSSKSYTVLCVYEEVELPSGAKALVSYSNLEEIKALFIPTKLDTGKYTVDVTRIDTDFFRYVEQIFTLRPSIAMNTQYAKRSV